MARVSLRTLGTVRIEAARRSIGPAAGRPFALLLYLVCRRGQSTPRRVLQELLFPGWSESRSTHSLRQLVYRVRQLGVPVDTDAGDVQIGTADAWIDWSDILERGELGNADMELVAQGLFPGFSPDVSEGYREWFEAERSAVRLRLSRAVGLQLTQLRRAGRWDLVDTAAHALLALDPLSEEGTLARAEALAASGSKSAALRLIDDYLKELGEDQANLRLTPTALRRRISERLPEMGHRAQDDRIFVGREDAMRMLSAAGAAARAGTQQTVLVWGEPGIGKTRLLQEYKALACLQGALAFQVTCQPHDVYRPLGILSDLVGQLLQAPGALGCDPEGSQLLSRLVGKTPSPPLGAEQIPTEASLFLIIRAVEDLLSAVSQEALPTIFVDDAQWLDRASLRAIIVAFSSKADSRASLILASRHRLLLTNAEFLADNVTSIHLSPLETEPALSLTRHLLRKGSVFSTETERHILTQSRGNPFFIRLLCTHINTTGDDRSLQQTVGEMLERRLEQLTPEGIRVLEACVILGKNCTYARLERMFQCSRLQLLRALEELSDRGLIEVREGCFVSSHDLLSEAVTSRTSNAVSRALHAAAAEMLQQEFGPSQVGPLPWDCAEHWRLAGNHALAIAVLRSCAQRAIEIGRPTDAFATLRFALSMPAPDETRLDIINSALNTLWQGVNWNDATDLIAERKHLLRRLGFDEPVHDEFEMLDFAARLHADHGDPRSMIDAVRQCLTSHGATPRHRVGAARLLIVVAELTLDHGLAELAFRNSRSLVTGTYQQLLCDLLYHTCFGEAGVAAALAEDLIGAMSGDHPRNQTFLLNAGYALYRIGDSSRAEARLLEAFHSAKRYQTQTHAMHAALLLARLYWSTERFQDSEYWHALYSELYQRNADPSLVGEHSVLGARLALRRGDLETAESFIKAARRAIHANLELPTLFIDSCEMDLRLQRRQYQQISALMESALPLYIRGRNVGCQDDVTHALITGLEYLGRDEEAQNLLEEYFTTFRRDSFAVPSRLRSAYRRLTGRRYKRLLNPMQTREDLAEC